MPSFMDEDNSIFNSYSGGRYKPGGSNMMLKDDFSGLNLDDMYLGGSSCGPCNRNSQHQLAHGQMSTTDAIKKSRKRRSRSKKSKAKKSTVKRLSIGKRKKSGRSKKPGRPKKSQSKKSKN